MKASKLAKMGNFNRTDEAIRFLYRVTQVNRDYHRTFAAKEKEERRDMAVYSFAQVDEKLAAAYEGTLKIIREEFPEVIQEMEDELARMVAKRQKDGTV